MSVVRTQREVDSAEFAEWMAFYALEREVMDGEEREPTPDELSTKIAAFAAEQNARYNARPSR
jgi:hypothetical protein